MKLQYWATFATAFSVLIFLALARSRWGVRFGFCFVFSFQAVVCIVALSAASQTGKCRLGAVFAFVFHLERLNLRFGFIFGLLNQYIPVL